MGLVEETAEDLRTAPMQPLTLQPDPRGSTYGSKWLPQGSALECAYLEMNTQERFEAGRQQSDRMLKIFVDLVNGESPATERKRVRLSGRDYDVTSVKTIVAEGDEGAILEAVSV